MLFVGVALPLARKQLLVLLFLFLLLLLNLRLQILLRLLDLLLQGRGLGLKLYNGRRMLDLVALKAVEEASILIDRPRALVFHALTEVLLLRLDLILQLLVLLPDAAYLDSECVYLLGLGGEGG